MLVKIPYAYKKPHAHCPHIERECYVIYCIFSDVIPWHILCYFIFVDDLKIAFTLRKNIFLKGFRMNRTTIFSLILFTAVSFSAQGASDTKTAAAAATKAAVASGTPGATTSTEPVSRATALQAASQGYDCNQFIDSSTTFKEAFDKYKKSKNDDNGCRGWDNESQFERRFNRRKAETLLAKK